VSRREDRERADQGGFYRNGVLVHGAPGEKVDPKKGDTLILRCGVCRGSFTESQCEDHLKECQPGGAICGKCGNKYPPEDFLGHYKKCLGRLLEPKDAD
jgi:hypothetical protein